MKTPKTAQSSESNNTDTSGTFSYSQCELPPGMAYQYQNADIAQTRGVTAGAAMFGGGSSDTESGMCPNDLVREYMEELERLELNQDIRDPDDNNRSGRSKVVVSNNKNNNNNTLLPTVAEAPEFSDTKPAIPPVPQRMCGKRTKCWIVSVVVLVIVVPIAFVCGLFLSPDDSSDPLTTAPMVSQEDITTSTTTAATSKASTTTTAKTSTTSTTTTAKTSAPATPPSPSTTTTPATVPALYGLLTEKVRGPTLVGDTQPQDELTIFPVQIGGRVFTGGSSLLYDASSPGMFKRSFGVDEPDMEESWYTTLESVYGVDAVVTASVRLAIVNPEVKLELGFVGQDCATNWTYSVVLYGTYTTPSASFSDVYNNTAWTDVFYCNLGTAGTWSFKVRSFVTS